MTSTNSDRSPYCPPISEPGIEALGDAAYRVDGDALITSATVDLSHVCFWNGTQIHESVRPTKTGKVLRLSGLSHLGFYALHLIYAGALAMTQLLAPDIVLFALVTVVVLAGISSLIYHHLFCAVRLTYSLTWEGEVSWKRSLWPRILAVLMTTLVAWGLCASVPAIRRHSFVLILVLQPLMFFASFVIRPEVRADQIDDSTFRILHLPPKLLEALGNQPDHQSRDTVK